MVEFKYSEKANNNMIQGCMPELRSFCERHNTVFFKPTEDNKKKVEELMKTIIFPEIEGNVTCYIRYFGPWGMYHPEDACISICPLEIEKAPGGLVGVVKHEMIHLDHPEANEMEQEDKENYIEGLES